MPPGAAVRHALERSLRERLQPRVLAGEAGVAVHAFEGGQPLADAAEVAAHTHWRAQVDVLHVDLYDHEAAAPVLDSEAFYADCRQLLTPSGCMVVNLFGRSSSYDKSLAHITQAFGEQAVWAFKPTKEGNDAALYRLLSSNPNATL